MVRNVRWVNMSKKKNKAIYIYVYCWPYIILNIYWRTKFSMLYSREAGFTDVPENAPLPDSANATLNSGPWPVHYKADKKGNYKNIWT